MKVLKSLVFVLIFASTAFAQKPGFFVGAGGGLAQMQVGDFTVYNPLTTTTSEPLETIKNKSTVSSAHLTAGYNFTENWALQMSYVAYGTGKVNLAFPATGTGLDTYQRHVLKYKPTSLILMPSFTYAIGEKSRIIAGAGVNYGSTASHFEKTYIPGAVSATSQTPVSVSYAEETEHTLGLILSLGVDYLLTEKLSLQVSGNYTTMKTKVPSSPWTSSSKSSVRIDSFGADLSLAWHW